MSGLLTAKALTDLGHKCVILDANPGHREQLGLHYLHKQCGIPSREQTVYNLVVGDSLEAEPHVQYAKKMHIGEDNSLRNLKPVVQCWNYQDAYDYLWDKFKGLIETKTVTPDLVDRLLGEGKEVFSTVPLYAIRPEAICSTREVYVSKKAPEGIKETFDHQNVVIYNIDYDDHWYRYSHINGTTWTESREIGEICVKKVVSTNYRSDHENLHLIGRLGAWNKKWLAHDSYYETMMIKRGVKNVRKINMGRPISV